ncbi:wax ester/triacylglycerol synthase family O-acyltransferase [Nocardioides marmoriginsengisoli]|uniref:Diacylglycerol O-acyltransferase n=1 Tax=Nocardioides marmoriginsengisoli TaxID=661483 RepID=A0A3N0CMW8_9ACTN|nr:wax ester/triacylglycerol synthase family O-acyltransferase [Nocardioides marmoriginsengisoli]RNL64798.1 wax ester/triacylglycerol synthase family O-acyltransferase [Nocardioides marmoriginsengisoli]
MERLSGLDASFLYLESSAQLMHVCGILQLDPSTIPSDYSFGAFKADLEARISTIPDFRRKLKEVPLEIDHPVWVDDADFDINRHVHRLAVPSPGGPAELAKLCGHMAGIPLDRSRPLWEMYVIEGLDNGRIAIFTKMHHATVDGISGSNLISFLCSLEPGAPLLDLTPLGERYDAAPGDWELFGRGLLNNLGKPWQFVRLMAPTTSVLTKTIRRAREGTAMAAPLTAPRTSFNGNITGKRSVGYADISLEKIKEIRHAVEGATVNDVVLAISGGALRRYLEERGELPETSLLASVPVSVHGTSTKTGGTNKVSSMFTRLGTDVADPVERLRQLAEANAHAKDHHKAIPADTLQEWAEFAAPRTFGLAVRAVAKLKLAEKGPVIHNLVISNVPGPPVPLYFMGAKIVGFYPLGPVFHGAGLNVTVMSANGQMHVGLIACREAMPEIASLAAHFPEELDALHAAVLG